LNVFEFDSVGHTEIHKTLPLVHELNFLKVQIGLEMLKSYKSSNQAGVKRTMQYV
jgi:hypothetical protein